MSFSESQPVGDEALGSVCVRCKNCDSELTGRYCANCGQAGDVYVPSTKELVHELIEDITHSDSRLWRTLNFLWFRPGRLTQEYVRGRRASFLPPFRLCLIMSVVFFLLAPLLPAQVDRRSSSQSMDTHPTQVSDCNNIRIEALDQFPRVERQIKHACTEFASDEGATLMHLVFATLSKALFICLPVVALLNMVLYWRPRYRYAEHLLFFAHLHAFYFSVATVAGIHRSERVYADGTSEQRIERADTSQAAR